MNVSESGGLSRRAFKIIACASMLLDHFCLVFLQDPAGDILRATLGRIALPVFAYLIASGFEYTRSRFRFSMNILAAALISEVFYDLMKHGTPFCMADQNICFSLFLGLMSLICCDSICRRFSEHEGPNAAVLQFALCVLVTAAFAAAAWLIRSDYDFLCVVAIAIFRFFKNRDPRFGAILVCVLLTVFGLPGSFLFLIPFYFYNENRGSISSAGKYLFYAFYPAHMAALWLISLLLS